MASQTVYLAGLTIILKDEILLPFSLKAQTPCDLPGSCSQHRVGARPQPSSPSPTKALVSTPGWPSPLGGVAGCPALHSSFFWLPRLVLFVRELWMKLPPQLGSTSLASYHPKASPGRPQRNPHTRQAAAIAPSLHPFLAQFSSSLFLIPFLECGLQVLPESLEKEWSRRG